MCGKIPLHPHWNYNLLLRAARGYTPANNLRCLDAFRFRIESPQISTVSPTTTTNQKLNRTAFSPSPPQSTSTGNLGLLLCSESKSSDSGTDEEQPLNPLLCHLLENRFTYLDPDSCTIPESTLPLLHPLKLVHSQCTLTEMRGGQSAGLASVSWSDSDAKCVRTRKIVSKRDTACNTIIKAWRNVANRSGGVRSLLYAPESALLMGHLRFATSSRNMVSESHPHIWCPWTKASEVTHEYV